MGQVWVFGGPQSGYYIRKKVCFRQKLDVNFKTDDDLIGSGHGSSLKPSTAGLKNLVANSYVGQCFSTELSRGQLS
jgi:hypothetical protein